LGIEGPAVDDDDDDGAWMIPGDGNGAIFVVPPDPLRGTGASAVDAAGATGTGVGAGAGTGAGTVWSVNAIFLISGVSEKIASQHGNSADVHDGIGHTLLPRVKGVFEYAPPSSVEIFHTACIGDDEYYYDVVAVVAVAVVSDDENLDGAANKLVRVVNGDDSSLYGQLGSHTAMVALQRFDGIENADDNAVHVMTVVGN
ncbi:hypothetical protein BGX20_005917, partial [Mortierella sp. AD010]